jgi:hypothetical protein
VHCSNRFAEQTVSFVEASNRAACPSEEPTAIGSHPHGVAAFRQQRGDRKLKVGDQLPVCSGSAPQLTFARARPDSTLVIFGKRPHIFIGQSHRFGFEIFFQWIYEA